LRKVIETAIAYPYIPLFTQANVLMILRTAGIDLPATSLQNWTSRGIVKLVDEASGQGSRRKYSFSDVVKLYVIARLTAIGVAVSRSNEISDHISECVDGAVEEWRRQIDDLSANEMRIDQVSIKAVTMLVWDDSGRLRTRLKFESIADNTREFCDELERAVHAGWSGEDYKAPLVASEASQELEADCTINLSLDIIVQKVAGALFALGA